MKYIVEREQNVQGEGTSNNVRAVQGMTNSHMTVKLIMQLIKLKLSLFPPLSDHRKRCKRQSRPVVLSQMIDRALKVCQEFLESLEHTDIDISLETPETLTKEEWTEFIDNYYHVVQ